MAIQDVEYIQDLGLHDAEIVKLEIDYFSSKILFEVVTSSTILKLKFTGVTVFTFNESPDFKNPEIILTHEFSNEKQFRLYTTSCINYQIQFNEFKVERMQNTLQKTPVQQN